MSGTLYGVGVGPGDPELITLKAVSTIRRCNAVAVPNSGASERVALAIATAAVPEARDMPLLELDMPMTLDSELLRRSHEAAAARIIGVLESGLSVAFLTLGDPSIYSTYVYVHRIVRQRGFPAEIVPGVPSFCAAAARLGDALVEAAQPLHIIPASRAVLGDALSLGGTKVLMKSGKGFSALRSELESRGLLGRSRMVVNCGMAGEMVVEDLSTAGDDPGYFALVIIKDSTAGGEKS